MCHPERSAAEPRDLRSLAAAMGHIHASDALKDLIDLGDAPDLPPSAAPS